MTVAARKYNPGFLSDDELVASFCVRKSEFMSLMEALRECSGNPNIHQLLIGPRGSGKTTLLLRVAAEIRRDADLSSRFFPVVFAEESYEVSTAGEFWLECLSRLADQAPHREDEPDLRLTCGELRQIRDDRVLADRCIGALQDFSDRHGKRVVAVVENLNMMFRDIAGSQAGWRLRQTLQTEPRIILLASATSRFQEIDNPKRALYELFRVLTLRPLEVEECAVLWQTVSGRPRPPETIRALRILTGGSPRLLTILARFGGNLSFRRLMADLLDLVDDHTEYFKSHLDALPHQERRVYLALADLWKPATTREIADRARLDTSKCSAQLKRLTDRGAVEVAGGTARRKLYYVAERLYNIYYLLRRSRGPVPLIEALIRFMEGYYSPEELREFGARIAVEAATLDDEETAGYRRESCDHMMPRYAAQIALFNKAALELANGRPEVAIAAADRGFKIDSAERHWINSRGHIIRAHAHLTTGNSTACEQDVKAMLSILPQLSSLQKDDLADLCRMAVKLGFERMRDLIAASPSANLLLPLSTALQKELGFEPRVAKEVEEIAEDIRRDLKRYKKDRSIS